MVAAPAPVEIPALTSLRGVLALWVLVLHMAAGFELQGFSIARHYSAYVAQFAFSGGLAVDGFFILSGFILSLIDGSSSLEMVLDVCGMPKLDALRILQELVHQKIVGFR